MILVIGGSGSGKSAYAEKVALECQKEKRHFYLATMHVFGEEGQKKVERHKRMRAGKGFVTIEQPTDIMQCLPALREAGSGYHLFLVHLFFLLFSPVFWHLSFLLSGLPLYLSM